MAHVTCFCIPTVDCEKFRNDTPLTEINNVVDDGSVSLTCGAANTLRLKLHRFNFLCICWKHACIIRRQQIDQVEFGPYTVHVCANNRQLTVCIAMCFKYRLQRAGCLVISLGVQCGIGFFWREAASRGPSAFAERGYFLQCTVC